MTTGKSLFEYCFWTNSLPIFDIFPRFAEWNGEFSKNVQFSLKVNYCVDEHPNIFPLFIITDRMTG